MARDIFGDMLGTSKEAKASGGFMGGIRKAKLSNFSPVAQIQKAQWQAKGASPEEAQYQSEKGWNKAIQDTGKVAGAVLAAPLIMPALGAAGGAIGSGLGAAGSAIGSTAGGIGGAISQGAGTVGNFVTQNPESFSKIAGGLLDNQTKRLEQETDQGNLYMTPLQRRQQMMRNQAYQGA